MHLNPALLLSRYSDETVAVVVCRGGRAKGATAPRILNRGASKE